HFPSVLAGGDPSAFSKGSGRMELADAIVHQPIAMRVIVNRVWKWHFGTGLVNTPSNFGKLGEQPSNPELLEYLGSWFADNGYSIKKLQRLLMLSAVYQTGDEDSPAAFAKDAGNRWYWRRTGRRMTGEEVRDSSLFVAGALDDKMGGPSEDLIASATRRTLYGRVSRYRLDQFLQLFDFPAATISAEQRFSTNVPLQRLFFMNSDFTQQQAELIARKVADESDNTARIQKVYRIVYGRAPEEAEMKAGLDYLSAEPMRAYEERRAEKDAKEKEAAAKAAAGKPDDAKGDKPDAAKPDAMADSMMAGVVPGAGSADDKAKLLPVT